MLLVWGLYKLNSTNLGFGVQVLGDPGGGGGLEPARPEGWRPSKLLLHSGAAEPHRGSSSRATVTSARLAAMASGAHIRS